MPTKRLLAITTALLAVTLSPVRADDKPNYSDLAKLIHQAVVTAAPKQYEDRSGWGKTVPIPEKLPLPRLRTRVKVGDKEELPDGMWIRSKVWLDDPAKDVRLAVRDLTKVDAKTIRLNLDATVAVHAERERKLWRKGLQLLGLTTQADALVTATLDCEVGISFNAAKFPPELIVQPKVVGSRLELKEFTLRRVGPVLEGEDAKVLGDELKVVLQELIRFYEPSVKEEANRAIAQALKEGKGKVSADALLKAAVPAKPKE